MSGRPRLPGARRLPLLVATAGVALLLPVAASAHSFLIRSNPPAGARLQASPRTMTMYFSEAFVAGSERVTLRRFGGVAVRLASPRGRGAMISQPLPAKLRGVFVVSWRVLSIDGHVSLGEFAFAVGSGGAIPTVSAASSRSWLQVAATWLVFLGVALALGGLASERFVWRNADVPAAPVMVGILAALAGTASQLILLAGDRQGDGFGAGLSGGAIADVLGSRPGKLTVALLIAIAIASALLLSRLLRPFASLPLLAAVGLNSARGHSGTGGRDWVLAADIVHLLAVALWVGAIVHFVLVVARAQGRSSVLVSGARRYSRFALPIVLLIVASGVLTAIPKFRSVSAVTGSSYGRTLLIKAALVGVALLAAIISRQRALPMSQRTPTMLLRRLTSVEAGVLLAVLAAAAVLVNSPPPQSQAASAYSALGPPPLREPVLRLGDFTGQLVIALAATPVELQFTIVPPSDQPQESVQLSADALTPDLHLSRLYPRSCGPECFTIAYRLRPGKTVITAHVGSSVWQGGDAEFVVPSPIPAAEPQLLRRVVERLRNTRTVHLTERVTSGPASAARPASYTLGGRSFLATDAFASGAVDVRPISHRAGLTEVVFALPGSDIWYRFWLDADDRLVREQIVDQGHFIRRSFSYSGSSSGG